MSKRQNNGKWYQQKRWVIGSLLLFPPLGIPLLWLTRWPLAGKVGGSIVSGILLLSVLTSEANEPTAITVEPPAIETTEAPTPAEPAPSPAYQEVIAAATAATAELATAESSADWDSIADSWQRAIASLEDIPISSTDYSQARGKIAEYERNYDYAIAQKAAIEVAAIEAAVAQRQTEEQAAAQQQVAAEEAQAALSIGKAPASYVGGTCKELKASGVGAASAAILRPVMPTTPRREIAMTMALPANLEGSRQWTAQSEASPAWAN